MLGSVLSLALEEGQEKIKEPGAAKQQRDQSQQECPSVPGCSAENSSGFQKKIKQKAPTKAKHFLCCQNLSLLSRHKRKFHLWGFSRISFQFKSESRPLPEFPQTGWVGSILSKDFQGESVKSEINGCKEPFSAIFHKVHCVGGNNLT